MKTTAAATYYKDNDSIATMEDELESEAGKSTIFKLFTGSTNLLCTVSNKTPASIDMNNRADDVIRAEESSVASSITMESLAQRQQQTSSRPDSMDAILSQIIGTLNSGQVSSHADPLLLETSFIEGSSNDT